MNKEDKHKYNRELAKYLKEHRVSELTDELIQKLAFYKPSKPVDFLVRALKEDRRRTRVLVFGHTEGETGQLVDFFAHDNRLAVRYRRQGDSCSQAFAEAEAFFNSGDHLVSFVVGLPGSFEDVKYFHNNPLYYDRLIFVNDKLGSGPGEGLEKRNLKQSFAEAHLSVESQYINPSLTNMAKYNLKGYKRLKILVLNNTGRFRREASALRGSSRHGPEPCVQIHRFQLYTAQSQQARGLDGEKPAAVHGTSLEYDHARPEQAWL